MDHSHHHHGGHVESENVSWFKKNRTAIVSTILIALYVIYMAINIVEPDNDSKYLLHWSPWFAITSFVVFWEARHYWYIYKNIFKWKFDMMSLVMIASHTLYIYSIITVIINFNELNDNVYSHAQFWEGVGILILASNLGMDLESKVNNASDKEFNKMKKSLQKDVNMFHHDHWMEMGINTIEVGTKVKYNKGSLITLNGIALEEMSIDYSNITGESKIINVKVGEQVQSGGYVVSKVATLETTTTFENSTINQITNKVEEVSAKRSKAQKLVDKILGWFTPLVILTALISGIIWFILSENGITPSWVNNDTSLSIGVTGFVTVLAIACPCALGVATPLIYSATNQISYKNGVIINNMNAIENVNDIKVIAFDKTGTLTENSMEVVQVEGDLTKLDIAIQLEKDIDHPIAKAILDYKETPIFEGDLSNYRMDTYHSDSIHTTVALFENEEPIIIFYIASKIRKEAFKVIKKLKEKYKIAMVTGDSKDAANYVAEQLGIDLVHHSMTPETKSKVIEDYKKEGKVMFIGDGFNDSIVMKTSDVSVSLSSGSEITNSLADFSVASNNHKHVLKTIKLGAMNKKYVKITLGLSVIFNILAIPLALMLLIPAWLGATLMALSSFTVVTIGYIYKTRGKNWEK